MQCSHHCCSALDACYIAVAVSCTAVGCIQRIHNALVLFPELLRENKTRQCVFDSTATLVATLVKEHTTQKQPYDSDAIAQSYIQQYFTGLSSLSNHFTAKQQTLIQEWQNTTRSHYTSTLSLDELREQLLQPAFAHLHFNPFTVPRSLFHPNQVNGKALQLHELPRVRCESCNTTQPFYCTNCYALLYPSLSPAIVPSVALPFTLHVILHQNVPHSKSTALHTKLFCPQQVCVHTYPRLPTFDPATTVLLFPSATACSLHTLAHQLHSTRAESVTASPSATNDGSSTPSQLRHVTDVIVMEGTWDEAALMLQHKHLTPLTHVIIDSAFTVQHLESAVDGEQSGTNGAAELEWLPTIATHFWRFQRYGASYLSSIEAIFYFLLQFHVHAAHLQSNDVCSITNCPTFTAASCNVKPDPSSCSTAHCSLPLLAYHHRYDNILWLFQLSHRRMLQYYQQHSQLLPLYQAHQGE